MKETKIRQATLADIHVIRNVADIAFRDTYKEILTNCQIDYMMQWMYSEDSLKQQFNDNHVFFVAFVDELAIGYVSVSTEEAHLFHLQKIYVLPAFQKQGVGSLLMNHVIEYVRNIHSEPCRIELNVNRENKAVAFYHKMGWKIVRQGDFSIGNGYFMNDFIMIKDL